VGRNGSRTVGRIRPVALTAKRVERLKTPGRYRDEHGLYLQVTNAENRSWIFRFERDGKEYAMGLGPTHTVSLSLAREKARAARLQLLDGVNPLQARRNARAQEASTRTARPSAPRAAVPRWRGQRWRAGAGRPTALGAGGRHSAAAIRRDRAVALTAAPSLTVPNQVRHRCVFLVGASAVRFNEGDFST
jgi:hypothetical protein